MLVSGLPAGCAVDGLFYVIGGAESSNRTYAALQTVFAYNPQTDSWQRKRDMPTPRRFLTAVAVDNTIYVIGGSVGPPLGVATNLVEAYDPATDTWSQKKAMPTPRACPTACALNGIIYVLGGAQSSSQPLTAVEAYDPQTDSWTTKARLPMATTFPASGAVNGRIYAFMGTSTFEYNPLLDSWRAKATHEPWCFGQSCAVVDGTIYLFGGMPQNMVGSYDFSLAYDPAQDRFSARRRMPRPRVLSPCAAIDGRIYIAAGVSMEPLVNPGAEFYVFNDVFDPSGGISPLILELNRTSPSSFHLAWQAEQGIRYGIETNSQPTGQWRPTAVNVLADTNLAEAICPVSETAARCFFRVFETK